MAGRPRALGAIAAEGDRLATLESLRDKLARTIDNPRTLARDMAPLARLLVQVTAEIDEIKKPTGQAPQESKQADDGAGVTSLDRFRKDLAKKQQAASE